MSNPDLTLILNPSEIWPEPSDCPAWPLASNKVSAAQNPPGSRHDAEQRLASLHKALNGDKPVRAPTDDERHRLIERHFTDEPLVAGYSGSNWKYQTLGLPFIRDRVASDKAPALIVEAAHVRGHLRHLAAKAEADENARAEAEEAKLKDQAENWPAREKAIRKELDSLAEAEARHQQRLDDEQAVFRANELRQQLSLGQRSADRAAAKLEAA